MIQKIAPGYGEPPAAFGRRQRHYDSWHRAYACLTMRSSGRRAGGMRHDGWPYASQYTVHAKFATLRRANIHARSNAVTQACYRRHALRCGRPEEGVGMPRHVTALRRKQGQVLSVALAGHVVRSGLFSRCRRGMVVRTQPREPRAKPLRGKVKNRWSRREQARRCSGSGTPRGYGGCAISCRVFYDSGQRRHGVGMRGASRSVLAVREQGGW